MRSRVVGNGISVFLALPWVKNPQFPTEKLELQSTTEPLTTLSGLLVDVSRLFAQKHNRAKNGAILAKKGKKERKRQSGK